MQSLIYIINISRSMNAVSSCNNKAYKKYKFKRIDVLWDKAVRVRVCVCV